MFPVLITYTENKSPVFQIIESPEKLPTGGNLKFSIIAGKATPQMRDLAMEMYNAGWTDCKKMAEK